MRISVPSPPPKPVYKPLRTSFRSKGFDYRQIDRKGNVAMFEQTKPELSEPRYEVVIVQRHDAYVLGGRSIEAAETMPSTSQWGRFGWTYRDPIDAKTRFDELVKRSNDNAKH